MQIDIITVLPELLNGPLTESIVKRAITKGLVKINVINLRNFASNKQKQVDDYQYGGGAGMVLMPEPIAACIESLQKNTHYDEVIFMTPDAPVLTQQTVNILSTKKNILILCGHYKGVDQRIRDKYITREISIGDYVLSGGELAAAVLTDAIVRLIPGAIGNETSALTDSHQDGLLSPPVYTRPSNFQGLAVPDILLSGNFAEIEKWRYQKAIEHTQAVRPDICAKFENPEK